MNTLTHHYVGQRDTRGQHSHPHFPMLRRSTLFFDDAKLIGAAIVIDG